MMDLNDNEFDAAFKRKVSDAEPEYEEMAWDKMEQKLKRRDRIVFARKAGAFSVFALALFIGLYSVVSENPGTRDSMSAKKTSTADKVVPDQPAVPVGESKTEMEPAKAAPGYSVVVAIAAPLIHKTETKNDLTPHGEHGAPVQDLQLPTADTVAAKSEAVGSINDDTEPKERKAIPLSLSISAGPEFNSASSLIGGDPGFSAGLALGIGITKRISLQAGVQYSQKRYYANNYAYDLNNKQVQSIITEIDAACAVLEFPLVVSYKISDTYSRGIQLNAGISSYLMLKEDYNFKYTRESGFPDRKTHIVNKNRHYLSVADLSATYFLKLKKEHLQLGVEPFVKIPLAGVGEGRIKLKSSGIALRLRYDIN